MCVVGEQRATIEVESTYRVEALAAKVAEHSQAAGLDLRPGVNFQLRLERTSSPAILLPRCSLFPPFSCYGCV